VFLYNPSTDKHVKKSGHNNRIKPCYQRDDIPEDDKDIEDMPLVEVTYPQTFPQTPQPMSKPEVEIPAKTSTLPASSDNVKLKIYEPPIINQPASDNESTEAQHGSLSTDNQDGDTADNLIYHDANTFWNALKIMRQSTGKGKLQYHFRWEDRNYPDTWSNASDVNDELK